MADELLDGEFWLPSHFLTDDDILMDFKSDTTSASGFRLGFTSGSNSDLASLTSDDDDLLHYSKPPPVLSGSPQSTLCGWELTHPDSGSGSGSPQKEQPKKEENNDIQNDKVEDETNQNATLDLLNKAAGEVAKMKLRTERSTGTGFFDCSNIAKTLPSPPVSKPNQPPPPLFPPPFYYHPQFRRFPPNMMWGPVQYPPPPPPQLQNRVTKNNSNGNGNGNTKTKDTKPAANVSNSRPLGLPPSAWPPLPGQAQVQAQPQTQAQVQPQQSQVQSQPQVQPYMGIFVGPQSASVGTGVFLPRRTTTPEPKKKSDGNVVMMTKKNKGTQRRSTVPAKTNDEEIKLPLEWVY